SARSQTVPRSYRAIGRDLRYAHRDRRADSPPGSEDDRGRLTLAAGQETPPTPWSWGRGDLTVATWSGSSARLDGQLKGIGAHRAVLGLGVDGLGVLVLGLADLGGGVDDGVVHVVPLGAVPRTTAPTFSGLLPRGFFAVLLLLLPRVRRQHRRHE